MPIDSRVVVIAVAKAFDSDSISVSVSFFTNASISVDAVSMGSFTSSSTVSARGSAGDGIPIAASVSGTNRLLAIVMVWCR